MLLLDAKPQTHPMTFYAESPEALENLFDDIPYWKGWTMFSSRQLLVNFIEFRFSRFCDPNVYACNWRGDVQKGTQPLFNQQVRAFNDLFFNFFEIILGNFISVVHMV